jgi:hypothetical protein
MFDQVKKESGNMETHIHRDKDFLALGIEMLEMNPAGGVRNLERQI